MYCDPSVVAAARLAAPVYPNEPPFHPHLAYPEYSGQIGAGRNLVYDSIRESFRLLAGDPEAFGTASWNPLRRIVKPGDRVVIKPNLLSQGHALRREEWLQVITHGSVVRAVVDYAAIALRGAGEIIVMDGPQYDSDWEQIMRRTGLRDVIEYCSSRSSVSIKLIDLRDYQQIVQDDVICRRVKLSSDPLGGLEVNLASRSALAAHSGSGRYYGSDYDQDETNMHHSDGRHEYRISRTAATADVFINLPKLKTHKKVGVTLCMKNLVGINMGRNWLPHHTDGDPSVGGDQFPSPSVKSHVERSFIRWIQRQSLKRSAMQHVYRTSKRIGRRVFGRTDQVVRHGNWYGNDTCWRMVVDINRCLMYGGAEEFPASRPKRFFAVIDGVIGGDGDGPACPDAHPAGVIISGYNPVAVDCVGTTLMGFDPMRLHQFVGAFEPHCLPLADFSYDAIRVVSNTPAWNRPLREIQSSSVFHFKPHFGWTGQIEKRPA